MISDVQLRAATACGVEHRPNERERSTDEPDVQEHGQTQHAKQTVEQPERGEREAPDPRSQPVPDQSEANRHRQRRTRIKSDRCGVQVRRCVSLQKVW
jgi:hypothetical protein